MSSCSQTRSAMQCCVSSHILRLAKSSSVSSKTLHLSSLLPDAIDPHSSIWSLLWQALMMCVQFIVYHGCSPAHFHTSWQAWYSNTYTNTVLFRYLSPSTTDPRSCMVSSLWQVLTSCVVYWPLWLYLCMLL